MHPQFTQCPDCFLYLCVSHFAVTETLRLAVREVASGNSSIYPCFCVWVPYLTNISNSSIWHISKTGQQSSSRRPWALRSSADINFNLVICLWFGIFLTKCHVLQTHWQPKNELHLGDFIAAICPSGKKKTLWPVIPGKGQLCKSWCVGLMRLLCNNVEEVAPSAKEAWGNRESGRSKIIFSCVIQCYGTACL